MSGPKTVGSENDDGSEVKEQVLGSFLGSNPFNVCVGSSSLKGAECVALRLVCPQRTACMQFRSQLHHSEIGLNSWAIKKWKDPES